jgi:hypothetical protein
MKMLLKAFTCLVVLGTLALANASSVEIEADANSIKGSADSAPLGQVLGRLAQEIGCDVYIDAPLLEAPVSFTIREKLSPEKAIQRMVRPHSYAMVFGTEDKAAEPRILEVWVFRKGAQHMANYVPLKREQTPAEETPHGASGGDLSDAAPVSTLTAAGRTITGEDLVRRGLYVERSALGTPVVKGRDPGKGPDYRPSPYQLRQAYERFRLAKHRAHQRMAETSIRQARLNTERNRQISHTQRNEELKNQILKSEQN